MSRMKLSALLISVLIVLSYSEMALAGVFLYVHFGDMAVTNEAEIQSTLDPNAVDIKANFYLRLTDGSDLYGYRFTVRYNEEKLDYIAGSREQTRPFPFELDSLLVADPDPGPVDQSEVDPFAGNFKELRRFHGFAPDVSNLQGDGFYKLASAEFVVENGQTITPGELLIRPGEFDAPTAVPPLFPADVIEDVFLSESAFKASGSPRIHPIVLGGTVTEVTEVTAVPEPSSAFLFAAAGILSISCQRTVRRLRQLQLGNLRRLFRLS